MFFDLFHDRLSKSTSLECFRAFGTPFVERALKYDKIESIEATVWKVFTDEVSAILVVASFSKKIRRWSLIP